MFWWTEKRSPIHSSLNALQSLLWDKDIEESFWHTFNYITHCSQNWVFNPTKFRFSQTDRLCWFPCHHRWHKTYQLPPRCHLLFSQAHQYQRCSIIVWPSKSGWLWTLLIKSYATFRDQLKPGMWYWDEALDHAFEDSKSAILAMVHDGIHIYELNCPTCLCTDWSKEGLSFTSGCMCEQQWVCLEVKRPRKNLCAKYLGIYYMKESLQS